MRVVDQPVDGLDRYMTAWEVVAGVQAQLDHQGLKGYVRNSDAAAPDRLEGVVAMLCQLANASAKLSCAAESLCAALVADRYRPSAMQGIDVSSS